MNYMNRLSDYQKENGLSTAEMARTFGVEWQVYKNWLLRESLPKRYYEKAQSLLDGANDSTEIKEAIDLLSQLSPEGLKAALTSIEAIKSLEKK